ncbi:MAG: methylglyoxal synthase [Defluviitaleaceae bacterium]|nr:methylglyoxal synthase [Defluviitaleaceae bacterium]
MKIAFVAHDSKKKLMENLCIAYRHILLKHEIYATGTTGELIKTACSIPVHQYLSGKLGGEHQLGAQIGHNDIDLVIFLRDPIRPASYEPDINSVLKLCDIHNIPLASNLSTAEILLRSLDRGDLDFRNSK